MKPEALLSTTAGSAAALVAIVGGLLVSRVISLATERSGLQSRSEDLQARLRSAEDRHRTLSDRLLRWEADEVLWAGREAMARDDGPFDIQAMIDEADVDRTTIEMRPFVEEAASRYEAIRGHLAPLFEDGLPGVRFQDLIDQGVLDPGRDDRSAYEVVWDALVEQAPEPKGADRFTVVAPSIAAFDTDWGVIGEIRGSAASSELGSLRRDTENARHQADALNVQLEQTELALARVARPEGVVGGLWVLAYMTVAGTFVPLAIMATGIKSMDWRGAFAVVGLFASGMVVLMVYLLAEVRRMTMPPSSPAADLVEAVPDDRVDDGRGRVSGSPSHHATAQDPRRSTGTANGILS